MLTDKEAEAMCEAIKQSEIETLAAFPSESFRSPFDYGRIEIAIKLMSNRARHTVWLASTGPESANANAPL